MPANTIRNPVTFASSSRRFGSPPGAEPGGIGVPPTRLLWLMATALFLGAFLLYFLTRTPALDEFDSINFAMGVTRGFNLWQDQPHAPGYPLFIFLGWLGKEVFALPPEVSLHFVSALGGGLLVAAWFGIIRLQFDERLAWWVAACLAVTPGVWMAATKVLTDSLASGLISLELLCAVFFLRSGSRRSVLLMSVCGAAAVGTRPQLILVAVIILATALRLRRATPNFWALGSIAFLGACLLWLLPMWYLQWRIHPELSPWGIYPGLLLKQWQWRLDKPGTYIGAGDWSLHYLGTRVVRHILGWFGLGFGFLQSLWTLVAGIVIAAAGLLAYLWQPRQPQDRAFWRLHGPWALVHVLTIFISLSGAQRYYLIIFPLLLLVLVRGLWHLPWPWSHAAWTLPALLLCVAVPLAVKNSREAAPSVRLVSFLKQLYPPEGRPRVVLLFAKARRHAEWYAPEFVTYRNLPAPEDLPRLLAHASAVYTDDANVPLPAGWRRIPIAIFARSSLIYMKDHFVELFLVERDTAR